MAVEDMRGKTNARFNRQEGRGKWRRKGLRVDQLMVNESGARVRVSHCGWVRRKGAE